MNKKLLIFVIMPILAISLVFAGVMSYIGQIQREVEVTSAFEFTPTGTVEASGVAGETLTSENMYIASQTSVNIPLSVETEVSPDELGIEHTINYLLDNSEEEAGANCGGYGTDGWRDRCEKRIDFEGMTLSSFNTMSWDVNVKAGYIAHVDVVLDNGETLVFEYAKVNPSIGCDEGIANYPTGEVNTFGDKGIVDSNAKAWLSSGISGGCITPAFIDNWKTLSEWKSTYLDAKILRFEIEVDNWIEASNSMVSNVVINGEDVSEEPILLPLGNLNFNVDTTFGILNNGSYTITTTVDVRE